MYFLKDGIKQNPRRRWALPDRIFYGHGACHILAGMYLEEFPDAGFKPIWLVPANDLLGSHVYVSDGQVAFDYHGYSLEANLLRHHQKVWRRYYDDSWTCERRPVDFPLLDTNALNARNMRGVDQYLFDARPRTRRYLQRIDHARCQLRVAGASGAAR